MNVFFFLVAALVAVSLGQSQVQPKAGSVEKQQGSATSQKTTQEKVNSALIAQMLDLQDRVQNLERTNLALQTRLGQQQERQSPAELREASLELARFDCETEFDKAHALALAQRVPS